MEFIDYLYELILSILSFEIFKVDNQPLTFKSLAIMALILFIGFWVVKKVVRGIEKRLQNIPNINKDNLNLFVRIIHITLAVVLLTILLNSFGIPVSSLAFMGSAFVFGLGLGMQNLFSNFVSGFIIIFEKTLTNGDFVEIDGRLGKVEKVNNRFTEILTPDLNRVLVPNGKFLENTFINWRNANQTIRLSVSVGVEYGSDTDKVKELLLEIAKEDPYVSKTLESTVLFRDFGDSALVFELYSYARIQSRFEKLIRESDLRFAIDKKFKQHGITIAFPQVDLHFDSKAPLTVNLQGNLGEDLRANRDLNL